MKWISVKKRLPSECKYYLIGQFCNECLLKKPSHLHTMSYRGPDIELVRWTELNKWSDRKNIPDNQITHWLDFPNTP